MGRYSSFGGLDTRPTQDGDAGFVGLNNFQDRALLKPGYLYRSENKRLQQGSADTLPGTDVPDFANGEGIFYPLPFNGSGVYSNPNGQELLMISIPTQNVIWGLRYGQLPTQIPIVSPETVPLIAPIWFVQAFDKILLLRTESYAPLVWDG